MMQSANDQGLDKQIRYGTVPRFQLDFRSFGNLHWLTRQSSTGSRLVSRYAAQLAIHFPEIAVRIDESDFGILHLEVGVLKAATREAIINGDWYTVRKHYNFVADLYERCGLELCEALEVSYLGNLLYGEGASSRNFAVARLMLPKKLAIALEQIERHYEDQV